jgi:uncharacterized damage-inducible protein DinB
MLDVFLESWDRQAKIIDNLFEIVDDRRKLAKPSDDGMPIFEQFAHIHNTRRAWLSQFSPAHLDGYGRSYVQIREERWEPVQDLAQLRELLGYSARAVRQATEQAILAGQSETGG